MRMTFVAMREIVREFARAFFSSSSIERAFRVVAPVAKNIITSAGFLRSDSNASFAAFRKFKAP